MAHCDYCGSNSADDRFHSGTCENCGAPRGLSYTREPISEGARNIAFGYKALLDLGATEIHRAEFDANDSGITIATCADASEMSRYLDELNDGFANLKRQIGERLLSCGEYTDSLAALVKEYAA